MDQTTGTIRMKAEFPNPDLQLWPGQFVNIRVLVETLKQVVTVPTAAVQRGPNGTFVYVIDAESKVAVRPITIAMQDDARAVISDGVKAQEQVVTTGFTRLSNGTRVRVQAGEGEHRRMRRRAPRRSLGRRADRAPAQARGRRQRGEHRRQAVAPAFRDHAGHAEREAMNVSAPFITRPIATSLLGVAVMFGGLLGYWWLPVSALPQVDFPTIQVTTQLPGASPTPWRRW